MKVKLAAFSVLRNGIDLGYVFLEAYRLVLPFVDTLYIQDGYSEDETYPWLERFKAGFPSQVHLTRYRWPQQSTGFAIGTATNRCLDWARSSGATHLLYVQADEIWHPNSLAYLINRLEADPYVDGVNFPFLHLQNNLQETQPGAGYTHAIRLVRNEPYIRSHRDAWTFEGCRNVATYELPKPIVHNNRSFWDNIPRKLRNHADLLYADLGHYKASADEAESAHRGGIPEMFLRTRSPYEVYLPDLVLPLLGKLHYEPRLELCQ